MGFGFFRPSDWTTNEYKNYLLEDLKKYKGAIAESLYNALNAMLELEISALSTDVTLEQRRQLKTINFDLYRDIANYNIFIRTQKLFNEDKDRMTIHYADWTRTLSMYVPSERIVPEDHEESPYLNLFKFDFTKNDFVPGVPDRIGDIILHKYEVREGQNAKNVEKLKETIVQLGGQRYGTVDEGTEDESDEALFGEEGDFPSCGAGDDMLMASYLRNKQIEYNQKRLEYYKNKQNLTASEKLAIELSEKYYGLLLKEFGFLPEEFKPCETYVNEQVLKLRRPNFNVHKVIHYVE